MNREFEQLNQNRYEGNGWSKYQLMVLQQLNDHNTVLQNLNKEVVNINQLIAVAEAETKIWKTQTTSEISSLTKDVEHILYDEKGLNSRFNTIERELDVEQQANTKNKAMWALYGTVIMFIANVLIQVISLMLKLK